MLLWYFYKPLFVLNVIFTLSALYIVVKYGLPAFAVAVSFKLISYTAGTTYQSLKADNAYYYFRNVGRSVRRLYLYSYLFDFVVFLLMVSFYIVISYAPATS